nr:hypothetical protein GCM10020093_092570 [Planobispora longispora]
MGTGLPDRGRRPSAGRVLAVASALPALALAGWLAAGLPLLLLGWFRPLAAVPLGLAAAGLLCRYGLRRPPGIPAASGWQAAAVVAAALGSGIFNAVFHSEQLIVRRDPATYAQYAVWLATRGSLPIPYGEAAFGGPDPALRFGSVGFYDHGGAVVPQFMPGPPMVHAIGHWLGGAPGLLLTPPVLGALAVLVFAGTVARLAGARWAALAAPAFAVSLPILYTSRTAFSEIPSLILLFGGMSLLLDARARLRAARRAAPSGTAETPAVPARDATAGAAVAGLVFGLAILVRIDGLRDVLPVLVYAGLWSPCAGPRAGRRRRRASGGRRIRRFCPGDVECPRGRQARRAAAGRVAGGRRPRPARRRPARRAVPGLPLRLPGPPAGRLRRRPAPHGDRRRARPRLAAPLRRLARIRRLPGLAGARSCSSWACSRSGRCCRP